MTEGEDSPLCDNYRAVQKGLMMMAEADSLLGEFVVGPAAEEFAEDYELSNEETDLWVKEVGVAIRVGCGARSPRVEDLPDDERTQEMVSRGRELQSMGSAKEYDELCDEIYRSGAWDFVDTIGQAAADGGESLTEEESLAVLAGFTENCSQTDVIWTGNR